MNWLEQLDQDLFLWLNGLHVDFLDDFMVAISGKFIWFPLYAILLFLIMRGQTKKEMVARVLYVGVLIFLADWGSVHFFKDVIQRYRPCHNELIQDQIYLLKAGCGGQYGFVSSHASNMAAIALGIGWFLKQRWLQYSLLVWAVVISYSRIYLGVHYPLDILGGWIWAGTATVLSIYLYKQAQLKWIK